MESMIYEGCDDTLLTDRQKWLKYEYIKKKDELNELLNVRKEIDKKISDLYDWLL